MPRYTHEQSLQHKVPDNGVVGALEIEEDVCIPMPLLMPCHNHVIDLEQKTLDNTECGELDVEEEVHVPVPLLMPRHFHVIAVEHKALDCDESGEHNVGEEVHASKPPLMPCHGRGIDLEHRALEHDELREMKAMPASASRLQADAPAKLVKDSLTQMSVEGGTKGTLWKRLRNFFCREKGNHHHDHHHRALSVMNLFRCGRRSIIGHRNKEDPLNLKRDQLTTDACDDLVIERESCATFDTACYHECDDVSRGACGTNCHGSPVLINLYELSSAVAFLNRNFLLPSKLGIFHCGVEAYNLEWSFAYRGPEDESTGVVQCKPKMVRHCIFRESLEIGWCDLNENDFKQEIRKLCYEWRSNSYHLTRRNCLMFAEALIGRVGLGHQFPEWLKTVYNMSNDSPALSSLIDGSWEFAKWWMTRDRENVTSRVLARPLLRLQELQLHCNGCCSVGAQEQLSTHDLEPVETYTEHYPSTEDLDKLDKMTMSK